MEGFPLVPKELIERMEAAYPDQAPSRESLQNPTSAAFDAGAAHVVRMLRRWHNDNQKTKPEHRDPYGEQIRRALVDVR